MGLTKVQCDNCHKSVWVKTDRIDKNTKVYCGRKKCKKSRQKW